MNLFSNVSKSILPFDGEVFYYPNFINTSQKSHYYERLLEQINWKNDEMVLFGKKIIPKRKVALYGNLGLTYQYSNAVKTTNNWIPELIELKSIITKKTKTPFNACLLNLYHNGSEAMGWHSDNEKELGNLPTIASLSLGTDRKFSFKHKENKKVVSIVLEKGSLLVMKGTTQNNWLHRLHPTTKIKTPRINLTFRNIIS